MQELRTLLRQHVRSVLGVAVVALVVGFVLTSPSILRPRYASRAVVYPVNLEPYANESRTDQLLQLMESNSIRDSLVRRFHLVDHYGVDTTRSSGRAELHDRLQRRIEITKTRFESVEVEMEDEDPAVARDLVNELLRQTDMLALRLHREKSAERAVIAQERVVRIRLLLDSVDLLLDTLRTRGGLLDYSSQSRELVQGYMRLLARGGGEAQKQEVRRMMDDLERHGGLFKGLSRLSEVLHEDRAKALIEQEEALQDLAKDLTYTNVVVHPEIGDRPVFPLRWLLVIAGMCSATFLYLLLLAWNNGRSTPHRRP
ncbi:MAG TPA: hypothetical protein VGE21_11670 [Flavobacteriales bacterium]